MASRNCSFTQTPTLLKKALHLIISSAPSRNGAYPRLYCISCRVRSLVMPHSATIIASGDEISTTLSWNSGVNSSQYRMSLSLIHI